MATHVLITIDGVLAEQGDEPSFAAAKFLPEGNLLFKSLASTSAITLLALRPESERTKVEYWLKAHGLREHTGLLFDPNPTDLGRSVELVVNEVRRTGPLDLAVEASPERAARLIHHGVSTLLLGRPAYTRGEFQPGTTKNARPWQDVVEELDAQWATNSEDERVAAEVAGKRFTDD